MHRPYTVRKGATISCQRMSSQQLGVAPVKRYHPGLVVLHWLIAILIFITALLAMSQEGEGRGQGAASIAGIPILGFT